MEPRREHGGGDLGLKEVVDPRAAAAAVRIGQGDESEPRHGGEKRARLSTDPLRVREVAGVVVRDRGADLAPQVRRSDFGEKLECILRLRGETARALPPFTSLANWNLS